MSSFVIAAQFTITGGQPATGLALADIELYLTRVHNTTGTETVIWTGAENPTIEVDNCGAYARLYVAADTTPYSYFAMAHYTGATVLDTDYVMGTLDAASSYAVWTYTTRTLTSASTAPGTGLTAGVWTVYRGDNLDRTFADIAADATITKVQLTVKTSNTLSDSDAILAIDSASGLLYLNGEDPGSLTATFSTAGVLAVPAATMAELETQRYDYDVQVWRSGAVETIEIGKFTVKADITKTVTT